MRPRRALPFAVALAALCAAPAAAQDSVPPGIVLDSLHKVVPGGLSAEAVKKAALRLLQDPVVLNHVLSRSLAYGSARWRLLRDLKVRFKTFEGAKTARTALGLEYSYAKSMRYDELKREGANVVALDFAVGASGNVAFDRTLNPRDFLDANLAFDVEVNRGGVIRLREAQQARLDELELVLVEIKDEAALEQSAAWQEAVAIYLTGLTTQVWVGAAAKGRFESDQTFDHTQWVYGADVAFDLKAWNPDSPLARWNFFDWPFAAIRWLAGTDPHFTPRGQAWPTVRVGLAAVDVAKSPERAALKETGTYPRIDLEAAMKSRLIRAGDNEVYFAADLRWFQELGAPQTVKDAHLATSTYFAATVGSSLGPYFTYSAGRLPFDLRGQQVYELGCKFKF
ncbi:MAG: hypothetical protein ACOY71_13930 [Gemmatimonadota bacterium]